MSLPTLMPSPIRSRRRLAPERVNYATGVLLQAEDFRDEQTYHRGRLATALRHLVGFGTRRGPRRARARAPRTMSSNCGSSPAWRSTAMAA